MDRRERSGCGGLGELAVPSMPAEGIESGGAMKDQQLGGDYAKTHPPALDFRPANLTELDARPLLSPYRAVTSVGEWSGVE